MTVDILPALKDNYIYMLRGAGECAAVDPGEAAPVFRYLEEKGCRLTHILCTHHHWDHIDGVSELAQKTRCEVWASAYDQDRIPFATRGFEDDETFTLYDQKGRTLGIPGHTLGHMAFYFAQKPMLFPGDTLFSAGCGRLFEGTYEQMFESLGKLKALPKTTLIYFGHEYTVRNLEFVRSRWPQPQPPILDRYFKESTERRHGGQPTTPSSMALELEINPFLRASTLDEFRSWREARNSW